jgi:soluble lytic murein transglycosylase-like protein
MVMSMRNQLRARRRPILITAAVVAVVVLAVGLWAFQPWKLFTHNTVDEAPPTAAAQQPTDAAAQPAPPPPAAPQVLAQGEFVSQEHATSGVARLVRLADGSRYLRLEGFSTSDGPDVHVWLTDQPSGAAWNTYDDGRYLPLGQLKGTDGNQNYAVPADADLSWLRSVSIWCDRFNVSFGSAPLSA